MSNILRDSYVVCWPPPPNRVYPQLEPGGLIFIKEFIHKLLETKSALPQSFYYEVGSPPPLPPPTGL